MHLLLIEIRFMTIKRILILKLIHFFMQIDMILSISFTVKVCEFLNLWKL